jgi:hypothetical protein
MELVGMLNETVPADQTDADEARPAADVGVARGGEAPSASGLRGLPPRQQRRLILDLLRAGKSDLEIGERFALSQWQVRNLRYRLGLKKDRGGRLAPRGDAGRVEAIERELVSTAQRIRQGAAAEERARRLPRLSAGEDGERMGVRLAGRFPAAEAGRRLTALGGLLSASDGRYEVRLALHQLDDAATAEQ